MRCDRSLGYGAARSLGFVAALLLGYYVVPFLGYSVERTPDQRPRWVNDATPL
jgi:hypothetical protein